MKNRFSKNQWVVFIGLLLLMLGVAGTYYYFLPDLQSHRELVVSTRAQSEGLDADIKTLTDARHQLDSAKATLIQKGVDFSKVAAAVPATESVPELYIQMEDLIKTAENTLGIVKPTYQISTPLVEGQNIAKVPVAVGASGTYPSLKAFITNLEHNIRPLTITSLSFTQPTNEAPGSPDNIYTLTVTAFARSESLSPAYSGEGK
jgi:Tfp pilus assembly protein PilO